MKPGNEHPECSRAGILPNAAAFDSNNCAAIIRSPDARGPLSLRWAVHTSGCIHPSGWNGPRCFHAHLPTELFPVLAQRFFGRSPCFFFYKYHVRDKISTIFPERIIRPCVLAALCAVEPQGFYYGGTGESEFTFQDRSARLCTVCGGSGRTERSEP